MVPGVLVEEFVDGPEFSIDSLVRQGHVTPLFVASKLSGLDPYFEELGHVVSSDGLQLLPEIEPLLQAVHEAIGFVDGATHTEVRVTDRGYRLMEINARLGGDLIPHLGLLATGIDLLGATVDVALGRKPDLRPSATGTAAIRFIYPPRDMELKELRVPPEVLAAHGAVSAQTARAMAEGVRARAGTSIGVGVTGIAGPGGGSEQKPVGTVAIAVAGEGETRVRTFQFLGGRDMVKFQASQSALNMTRLMVMRIQSGREWAERR
jgi:PncC family amidohydrolase